MREGVEEKVRSRVGREGRRGRKRERERERERERDRERENPERAH